MLLTSEAVRGDGSSTTSAYQGLETHHLLLPYKGGSPFNTSSFRKGKALRRSISLKVGFNSLTYSWVKNKTKQNKQQLAVLELIVTDS